MRLKKFVIHPIVDATAARPRLWRHAVPPTLIAAAIAALMAPAAEAATGVSPVVTCDAAGIGQAKLLSDLPTLPTSTPANDTSATILSASTASTTSGVQYCLVKVLVQPAINIWVGLPMGGAWNVNGTDLFFRSMI